jgi:hypothetical protein
MVTATLGPGWQVGGTLASVALYKNALLMSAGGSTLSLHAIGTAAGISGAGCLLLAILDRLKMTQLVSKTTLKWLELRIDQVEAHIKTDLSEPLFAPWIAKLAALRDAPIDECRQAFDEIERLAAGLAESETSPR